MNGKNAELKLKVYIRLVGEEAQRFKSIRNSIGLKNDTEVLRYLISYYYYKLEKKESLLSLL